jgi:hypothetical protein
MNSCTNYGSKTVSEKWDIQQFTVFYYSRENRFPDFFQCTWVQDQKLLKLDLVSFKVQAFRKKHFSF